MKLRKLLCLGVAMGAITSQAHAADIILVDQGFAGTPEQQAEFRLGFQIAAAYWSSVLSNNVTIRLGVGSAALPTNVIGSTGSSSMDYTVKNWEAGVNATKSNSAVDTNIVLPTLSSSGAVSYIANGPNNTKNNTGINTKTWQWDADTSGSNSQDNKVLYLNTANVKAIGGTATYDSDNTQQLDGNVQFSTAFNFDFNPTDGIDPNHMDFIGVAIHEIGHALGFVSGTDFIDLVGGPNGYYKSIGNQYNWDLSSMWSALDMFRYSNDPHNVAPGSGPALDMSVGTASYFSIDGGLTQWGGSSLFATGVYNGDGDQTSHWKDLGGCGDQEGIMDPNFCYQQYGEITALDLAAFDAIGWNIAADSQGTNYLMNTADIYRKFAGTPAVPEPATWAMMMMGFGLMGAALRRSRKVTTRIRFA